MGKGFGKFSAGVVAIYNQRDYAHVPYPAPGYPDATVKSGGCGPTCMAMIVETLLGVGFDPTLAAAFAMTCGARVAGGTDMKILSAAICKAYPLMYTTSNSVMLALDTLLAGGMVIANCGGDDPAVEGDGVFSDGGHYICLFGDAILDPGLYAGKYDRTGREKVKVHDGMVYASLLTVDGDTRSRSPRYYCFSRSL